MDNAYQESADVHVLPTNLSLPGLGVLPINAYLVMAQEPVDEEQFVDAVSSIMDRSIGCRDPAEGTGAGTTTAARSGDRTAVTEIVRRPDSRLSANGRS